MPFGFIKQSGGPSPTPGPTIMPTLPAGYGRYFFIDGDNGDDSHDGYIDAPLGSTFSGADSAAHAVKTTDRLEAVTPMLGNGQFAIRLWKPRAGGAVYDKTTPGDGLGRCDRRLLSGYQFLLDRGSDHTNSADFDRAQLGAATTDGPFNVNSTADVFPIGNGEMLVLDGADFAYPAPFGLTQKRLHIIPASGPDRRAAVQWGDPTAAAASNVVTTWYDNSTLPGDSVQLEVPGVRVAAYFEAVESFIGNVLQLACLQACGFEVAGDAALGCAAGGSSLTDSPFYCFFVVDNTTRITGVAAAGPHYVDETGVEPTAGFGLVTKGGGFSNGDVTLDCSSVNDYFSFNGRTVSITRSRLSSTYGSVDLAPDLKLQLAYVLYSGLYVGVAHAASLTGLRHTGGVYGWIVINPGENGINGGGSIAVADAAELDGTSTGKPGIMMNEGQYTVALDLGNAAAPPPTVLIGTGIRLQFASEPSTLIDVEWGSLVHTGFEIEGGFKVVCFNAGLGFPDNRLPCPRAKLMQFQDTEGAPVPIPVGQIVSDGGGNDNRVEQAIGLIATSTYRPVGFTVTNALGLDDGEGGTTGGFVLVSCDSTGGFVVVEVGAAYPNQGDPAYLSMVTFGAATSAPPARSGDSGGEQAGPVYLGRAQSVGYNPIFEGYALITWEPSDGGSQVAQAVSDMDVASSTALADIPGVYAYVVAGRTYRVRGLVVVDAAAVGGSKVSLAANGAAADVMNVLYTFVGTAAPAVAVAYLSVSFGDSPTENVGNGAWVVDGSFRASASGFVSLQFAQAVSDPTPSTAQQGSCLDVTEQT